MLVTDTLVLVQPMLTNTLILELCKQIVVLTAREGRRIKIGNAVANIACSCLWSVSV
jgi:hypothetical protein